MEAQSAVLQETKKQMAVTARALFGRLQTVKKAGEYRGESFWECRCNCGNRLQVLESRLVNGEVLDCGCQSRTRRKKDLTGQRFGRLTAVRYEFDDERHQPCWTFQCDCGNTKILSVNQVKWCGVQSCGCLRREKTGDRNRKDLSGKRYGRLTAVRQTGSRDDPGTIIWECRCDCGNTAYYSVNMLNSGKARSCGCLFRESRQDCVKARTDLVEDTSLSGILASKKRRINNTSGVTGVHYIEKTGKWTSYLSYKKKRYYLGIYERKEDAVKAREHAEQELHDPMIEEYWEKLPENRQDEYLAYLNGIMEYPPSVNI